MTVHDYKNATKYLKRFHDYSLNQFDYIITNQGNPNRWYHGGDEPLQHVWHTNGNKSICMFCDRTVEEVRK